jgi:hypothetical protein
MLASLDITAESAPLLTVRDARVRAAPPQC